MLWDRSSSSPRHLIYRAHYSTDETLGLLSCLSDVKLPMPLLMVTYTVMNDTKPSNPQSTRKDRLRRVDQIASHLPSQSNETRPAREVIRERVRDVYRERG